LLPLRTAAITNVVKNMGKKGTLIHCWWECKLVPPLWKTIWKPLKNQNLDLPYDPAIPLLGIYPKEYNSGYCKGTYTPMFIAALFTTSKLWKQLRCPITDEWIKKMWLFIHIRILFSHKEKKKFVIHK
jgi:hypothetical protein